MKNFILIPTITFAALTSFAELKSPKDICNNIVAHPELGQDIPAQIAEMYNCQSEGRLGACLGLAASVAGGAVATPAVLKYAEARYARVLTQTFENQRPKLMKHEFETWKAQQALTERWGSKEAQAEFDSLNRQIKQIRANTTKMRIANPGYQKLLNERLYLETQLRLLKNDQIGSIAKPLWIYDDAGKMINARTASYEDLQRALKIRKTNLVDPTAQNRATLNRLMASFDQRATDILSAGKEFQASGKSILNGKNLNPELQEKINKTAAWATGTPDPLDEKAITRELREKYLAGLGNIMKDVPTEAQKAAGLFDSAAVKAAKSTSGRIAARTVGGLALGGAFTAAAFVVDASTTACDTRETLTTNVQVQNGVCQPVYEVNETVASFLKLPPSEQLKAMQNDPKVCDYYVKLRNQIYNKPKIESIACLGDRITVIGELNGEKIQYSGLYKKGTRDIEILTSSPQGNSGFSGQRDELDENGILRGPLAQSKPYDQLFWKANQFMPEAHSCCMASGDDQSSCIEQLTENRSSRPLNHPSGRTAPDAKGAGGAL